MRDKRKTIVNKFRQAAPYNDTRKIWITNDKPVTERVPSSILFGIKKELVEWGFAKGSLWVDEQEKSISWNGDLIMSVDCSNHELKIAYGDSWKEFLSSGSIDDMIQKGNHKLQRSNSAQSKGKGLGKGKGKLPHDMYSMSSNNRFIHGGNLVTGPKWNIRPDEY